MSTALAPVGPDDYADERWPHDLAAEQAVLGAMLLSAAAAQQCMQALDREDFYRPAHTVIFGAIARAARAAEPTDTVAIAAALTKAGDISRVGGAPYLHTLMASVPAAANGGYYARIVREHAVRRRLLEATSRITQLAGDGTGDAHGLTERALREIENVRDSGIGDDLTVQTIAEFLDADEGDDFDWVVPGLLERGDRLILTGTEGAGKALALDTPIPTPKGWTTVGALTAGQEVFGPDGKPALVVAATGAMTGRPCYRVTFSDGAEIIADAGHQWLTRTLRCRELDSKERRRGPLRPRGTDQRDKRKHFPSVVTTKEIRDTLAARDGHALNHSVDTCEPLRYPAQELPIDPYTFGAWLGDGNSRGNRLTCHQDDVEIIEHIRRAGLAARKGNAKYEWCLGDGNHPGMDRATTITARLRRLGVLRNKHIPDLYKLGSAEQRLAVIQGLMDTDGTVSAAGSGSGRGSGAATCELTTISRRLAEDFLELVLSMGIKARLRAGTATLEGRVIGPKFRVTFQTDLPVFRLARKAKRLTALRTQRARLRYITAVEPVDSVPVRCIQVDRPDGMFLAGPECIPTHNSTLFRMFAVCIAAGIHPFTFRPMPPMRVLLIDCENSDRHTRRKIRPLVTQARLQGHEVDEANLWIECRPVGIDLALDKDVSWLLRQVAAVGPDVTFLGPLYRLAPRALNDDSDAAPVIATLNMVRARGCAVVLEAHSGHAIGAGGFRDPRPRGSSAFLGWPEFGYGLRWADGSTRERRIVEFVSWRGDRDEREWPEMLAAGGTWPWRPYEKPAEEGDSWNAR